MAGIRETILGDALTTAQRLSHLGGAWTNKHEGHRSSIAQASCAALSTRPLSGLTTRDALQV
jgi:hypothetical protein